MGDPQVFRWLIDVRDLWPSPEGDYSNREATGKWAATNTAKEALDLLPLREREKAVRFYFPRDARLSLASSFLKHLAVACTCNVDWKDAVIGEDANRKPCYVPVAPATMKMEFNVSHHGTLVALVGCVVESLKLGVDIVQMNWERDYPAVLQDGYKHFANIYDEVFSDREIAEIADYGAEENKSEEDIRAWLRHFYAHWCLKEAYIKMTALMDPMLRELEFRNVRVPRPVRLAENGEGVEAWGQICDDVEIWFRGLRVTEVKMELQAYGADYIIGTAASSVGCTLAPFQLLDPAQDIYPSAGAFNDGRT